MATLDQIGMALQKADATGNTEDARRLAQAYKALKDQQMAPAAPAAPVSAQPAAPQPGPMDFLTQGMSGVNEGIADTLGAPVELATFAMNKGAEGINALTHANLPTISDPIGGQGFFRKMMSPTIKPETNNPAEQMTRRVGQEVGAMLIPGMKPVAMAAKPLTVAVKELAAALGSGTGAAIAQQAAPGNLIAEMAGQIVGGFSPMALESVVKRGAASKAVPDLADLRTAQDAAYAKADSTGVSYDQPTYINMLSKIGHEAVADHISPTRHASAYSFIVDIAKRAGKPMTLTEMDQLRQEVRRELITPAIGNPAKAADAHFGNIILDKIDETIASDARGGEAITAARAAHSRLKKAETLADALSAAKLNAASSGSGGNLNNAIRQQIKNILNSPKKRAGFTADERKSMEALVKQDNVENLLRWLGKFSPGGNGLIGMLQVGGTILNPSIAALPVAGMVAKGIADNGTLNKMAALQRKVVVTPLPKRSFLSPDQKRIAGALATAQAANSMPLQITVNGGR